RVFEGEPIGIKQEEDHLKAYYGQVFLGNIQENTLDVERRFDRDYLRLSIKLIGTTNTWLTPYSKTLRAQKFTTENTESKEY
ncbi:hypothetical protein G9A89_000548, partial [Geosiphon pyriformis]